MARHPIQVDLQGLQRAIEASEAVDSYPWCHQDQNVVQGYQEGVVCLTTSITHTNLIVQMRNSVDQLTTLARKVGYMVDEMVQDQHVEPDAVLVDQVIKYYRENFK